MNKIKIARSVFIIVSALDLVGIVTKEPGLVFVFKPLILISLMLLYTVSVTKKNTWYVLALVCSFFGDVFLLFAGQQFFIIGLVSFLLAHLIFIKISIGWLSKSSLYHKIVAFTPFLITFSTLIYVLKDFLGEMLIPVQVYGVIISLFGAISLLNYLNTKTKKASFMFFGAVVFICSDSILAINKFYISNEIFEVLIMTTYVVAQYLIYRSMILGKVTTVQ